MARVDLVQLGELLARGDVDGALRLADPLALADALAVRLPRTADLLAAGCPLLAQGIAAGIGVASGALCLDARDAAARGATEPVVLVQRETSPEDVAGVRSAKALVEASGGLTSEGAVMARGLGLPCVVGATSLRIDAREGRLFAADSDGTSTPREVHSGARVTVCGTTGRIVLGDAAGAPAADQPALVALLAEVAKRVTLPVIADRAAPDRPIAVLALVAGATSELRVAPGRLAFAKLALARRALAPV